jgi:RNA polymerase sigma factor (TIGR02999 family)
MRRVLVDHARQRSAVKRGGPAHDAVPFDEALGTAISLRLDLVELDEALVALEHAAPDKARVVELRYFGGLSVDETAECMDISPATVHRHWAYARAWLYRWLTEGRQT